MDQKMTRRAVLGTVIGGLVVAPFVMRSFRRARPIEGSSPYGKIQVPLEELDSDLSLSERAKALEIFEKERNRWLSFRGVEGDVRLKKVSLDSGKEANVEGFLHLKFDLREPSDSRHGEYVPHDVQVRFSESESASPLWTIKWNGRFRSSKPVITGTDEGGIRMLAFVALLAPLTVKGLVTVANGTFLQLVPLMKLSDDPKNPGQGSYSFGSNEKLTNDGVLIPTWKFTEGHLSGYIPARKPNSSYPDCSMDNTEQSGDFLFSRRFEMKPIANGGKLSDGLDAILTMDFANHLHVFVA